MDHGIRTGKPPNAPACTGVFSHTCGTILDFPETFSSLLAFLTIEVRLLTRRTDSEVAEIQP